MATGVTRRPLGELLEALAEGEPRSHVELAARLDLGRDELEDLLRHLAALGLVAHRPIEAPDPCGLGAPSPACSPCPGAPRCPAAAASGSRVAPMLRVWVLTERGRCLARARSAGPGRRRV